MQKGSSSTSNHLQQIKSLANALVTIDDRDKAS